MNFLQKVPVYSEPKKTRKKTVKDPCKRCVPSAVLDRHLAKSKVYEQPWVKNRLYASSVCCDTYFDMTKELFQFWSKPAPEKQEYISQVRREQGNTKHKHLQEHWHSTGLTHEICTTNGEFKEPYCIFPEYAISGKIDLIIPDPKYLKALDKEQKLSEGELDKLKERAKIDYWMVCDIKETETQYYFGASEKLRQSYRGQLSLYIKWFHETHDGHEKLGSFWYQNRDTPKKHKLFEFERDDNLIQLAFDRGKEYIQHLNDRTFPNNEFSKTWIEDQIESWQEYETVNKGFILSGEQKQRKWPEYSNVNYEI